MKDYLVTCKDASKLMLVKEWCRGNGIGSSMFVNKDKLPTLRVTQANNDEAQRLRDFVASLGSSLQEESYMEVQEYDESSRFAHRIAA